jgi:uncharacterized protein (DUF1499 family)
MLVTLIVIGAVAALLLTRVFIENNKVPVLGVSDGKLAAISKKPNNVSSQTTLAAKKVLPLTAKETPAATMAALKSAVAAFGGGSIDTEAEDYLYVVFTTSLMKYRDDVEFWLDNSNNEVHYRSSSRAGYSDMGLNRARYDKIANSYSGL